MRLVLTTQITGVWVKPGGGDIKAPKRNFHGKQLRVRNIDKKVQRNVNYMKMDKLKILAVFLFSLWTGSSLSADMTVTEEGKARAVVLLGESPTWLENRAAEELVKYIKEMSGVSLKIVRGISPKDNNIILIGRGETNPAIKELCDKGIIRLSSGYPGLDGFIIKSLNDQNKNYLILGGSRDRGTLYAVYHFLENFCKVGFFWDGERIAEIKTIRLNGINLAERPRFAIRQYLQGGPFSYTTNYWDWKDWKKELDWMAKKKINCIMPPHAYRTKDYIIRPSGLIFRKNIIDYAHKLGMKCIGMHIADLRLDSIADYMGDARPGRCDPGDHIYQIHPYPEKKWNKSPKEFRQWAINYAERRVNDLQLSDPEGTYYMSGWAFTVDPFYWSKKVVKDFLEYFPKDKLLYYDLACGYDPKYQDYNYFYGKNWAFGVVHTMGNMNQLHGDMSYLMRKAKEVSADPRAENCIGFFIQPESIHHNTLYFELAARLAWNPEKAEMNDFLLRFARCRYGEDSAASMVKVLRKLVDSVYSVNGWHTPLYQVDQAALSASPTTFDNPYFQQVFERGGSRFIPYLKEALKICLSEQERQKGNNLYRNDLLDISRAYIRELFDYHIVQLISAYLKEDKNSLDKEIKICRALLAAMENVLFAKNDFWLKSEFGRAHKFKKKYGKETGLNNISNDTLNKEIRSWFKGFGWTSYRRSDIYELFSFQYKNAFESFLKALERNFGSGKEWKVIAQELEHEEIEKDWVEKGFDFNKMEYKEKAPEALKQMYEELFRIDKGPYVSIYVSEVNEEKTGWQEDFRDVSDWDLENPEEGSLATDGKMAYMNCKSKEFRCRKRVSISLKKYPIFTFRLNAIYGGPFIKVYWTDISGKIFSNTVFGGIDKRGINEYRIDIYRYLYLYGEPEKVVMIELNDDWKSPHPYRFSYFEWHWMKFIE